MNSSQEEAAPTREGKVVSPNNNEELDEIIHSLPPEKQKQVILAIKERSFAGPLPPPEILEQYNNLLPNATERIFTMAEKEQAHRIKLESMIVESQKNQSRSGQIFGFILVTSLIATSILFAFTGHETLAGIILSTTIVAIAIIFVLHKSPSTKKEE